MTKKKMPHELSVQELLDSLESESENTETSFEFDSPVLSFIQQFGIAFGKEEVSGIVLYDLFKLWYRQGSWNIRNFNMILGKYIPSRIANRKYYYVNKSTLDLAEKINTIVRNRKKDKRKSITWQKHFKKFIEDTELEKGNKVWVESDILYYVYNRWLDKQDNPKGTIFKWFSDIMELYFDTKIDINSLRMHWFYVSRNITKLITKEEIERWREGRNNKNGKDDEKYKATSKKVKSKYKGKTLYPSEEKKQKSIRPSKLIKKGIHTKKSSRPD